MPREKKVNLNDIVGRTFNRLTVDSYSHHAINNTYAHYYECSCICGTKRIFVLRGNLIGGISGSCNCLRTERLKIANSKYTDEDRELMADEGVNPKALAIHFNCALSTVYNERKRKIKGKKASKTA